MAAQPEIKTTTAPEFNVFLVQFLRRDSFPKLPDSDNSGDLRSPVNRFKSRVFKNAGKLPTKKNRGWLILVMILAAQSGKLTTILDVQGW